MENHNLNITVDDRNDGSSVLGILRREKGFSRTLLRRLKRSGLVCCNGLPVYMDHRVKAGDILVVSMPKEEPTLIKPEQIPLEIVYEDQDILAINKPANMLVHPVKHEQSGTLANAVLNYWKEKGVTVRFRPIYRLDRDTTGIVLVAYGQYNAQRLGGQLETKSLRRRYIALVEGVPPQKGTIDLPLAPEPENNSKWKVDQGGKPAVTHYRVISRVGNYSLLELELETGRTHQIRVHMSHIGYPLLGDIRYGGDVKLFNRQALHAAAIDFNHPRTGLPVKLRTPIPPDMRKLVLAISYI